MRARLLALIHQLSSRTDRFELRNTESPEAPNGASECQMLEILDHNPITPSTILQHGGLSRMCHRELLKDPARERAIARREVPL